MVLQEMDKSRLIGYLQLLDDRFGIPVESFLAYRFVAPSDKYFSIVAADHDLPEESVLTGTGMVFMRTNTLYPKLTTGATMMFGYLAKTNYVYVSPNQADAFLRRKIFRLSNEQTSRCTGFGYVIVRMEGLTLGLGLLKPDTNGGELFSLYPRAYALRGSSNVGLV